MIFLDVYVTAASQTTTKIDQKRYYIGVNKEKVNEVGPLLGCLVCLLPLRTRGGRYHADSPQPMAIAHDPRCRNWIPEDESSE
jgi:hypothetical protein